MLTSPLIDELKAMLVFCEKYDDVYLYGAGQIGRKYLKILSRKEIVPAGFIVTEGVRSEVDGVNVFPLSEIKNNLSSKIGVIAAFKGAEESYIRSKVGDMPGIFVSKLNLPSIFSLESELFPFVENISKVKPIVKPKSEWRNILIIRLDVMGDSIMSTAFIRELRKNCPESHITLAVRASNEMIFKDCPYISDLVMYDCSDNSGQEDLSVEQIEMFWQTAGQFVKEKFSIQYDIVFQLCPLLSGRGALEALMLGYATGADCQIGRIYAWKKNVDMRAYLYERLSTNMSYISYDMMPKHEVACMLDMLRRCGGIVENETLELWFDSSVTMEELLLNKFGIDIKHTWIAVGIVGSLPSQCWPADRYGQFLNEFWQKHNVGFIMFGGSEAQDAAKRIKHSLSNSSTMVIDLTGKTTLYQAMSVMNRCVAYVGANTGLMHMAAALGKPVVEISFYVRGEDGQENSPMGPWGAASIVLQQYGMDGCSEICSKPYPHCITQISVQEVMDATEKLLLSNV